MIKECITNEEVVEQAATKEIIRRYYQEKVNYKKVISSLEEFLF